MKDDQETLNSGSGNPGVGWEGEEPSKARKVSWFKLQFSLGALLLLIVLAGIAMPIIIEWKFETRVPVQSSNIVSIGHNSYTGTLEVEFKSGSVYQYADVPRTVFKEFLAADSKGRYFQSNIKESEFEFEQVR